MAILKNNETADSVLLRHLMSIRELSPSEYLGWIGMLIMGIVFLLLEFVFAMLCLGAVLLVALLISQVSGCNAIWEYSVYLLPFLGWFCYKRWVGLLVCAMGAAVFYVLSANLFHQEWLVWLYLFPLFVVCIGVWKFAQVLLYGFASMGGSKKSKNAISAEDFFKD